MKISLKWLSDYIDLSDIPMNDVIDKLSLSGLEVEEVIDRKSLFENIVIGLVKEKKSHPNADKLSLCVVSDGENEYPVVCGAPNVDANQKIAFAKIGAVMPDGEFKIKKAKIRGEISEGMICSEKELGISDNHEGIWVLDEKLKEGTPLAEALGMDDVIVDVAITPNRPDALSIIGIARDLAAIFGKELKIPEVDLKEEKIIAIDLADVEIVDSINCPRYVAKVVTDVTIKESPEWMKKKLRSIGLRPINNIVDITNFVLMEIGQPLHAFDLDLLADKKIIVKQAGKDREFTTLDSKKRKLQEVDLMICDADKHIAIAGVMGGENSEVTGKTKNILIESAYFHQSSVRKTSKLLGLSTDASYRFERGTDPNITIWAARRAAKLMAELADGKIASGEIDAYPNQIEKKVVSLRYKRIEKILGYTITNEIVKNILLKLGFTLVSENSESIKVEVPTYRPDIEREIDLIEEVGRIYGYEEIPTVEKISVALETKVDQSRFRSDLKNILTSLGLNEIMSNSLMNGETAMKFGNALNVMNPKTIEMSHLRTSLIPGALTTISKNIKVREKNLSFFEIGDVFEKKTDGGIKSFDDFTETEQLLITITGKINANSWFAEEREVDIFDLKGIVKGFLENISLDNIVNDSYYQTADPLFEYGFAKTVNKLTIGKGGKLNKEILDYFDITQDVFIFYMDLGIIKNIKAEERTYNELLKFPKVFRDCAFVINKDVDCENVINSLYEASSKLLKKIKLFDIFESDVLGKDKKSLAFQLEYFDNNRTLTEEEVEKDFWNAIDKIKSKFNAQLRGK